MQEIVVRPATAPADKMIWAMERFGKLTVKTVYAYLKNNEKEMGQSSSVNYIALKHLWAAPLPSYLQMFLWKLYMHVLPLGDRLAEKNMKGDFSCPFCNREMETAEHLFFTCDWTRAVWFCSQVGLRINTTQQPHGLRNRIELYLSWCTSKDRDQCMAGTHIMYLLHYIWRARNELKFDKRNANRDRIIRQSRVMADKCLDAFREDSLSSQLPSNLSRNSLEKLFPEIPIDSIVIRFDASYDRNTGWTGAAAIASNSEGDMVGAAVRRFKAQDIGAAEMGAAEVAVLLGRQLKHDSYVFEGDNLDVIKALQGAACPWTLEVLKTHINSLSQTFSSCMFFWISRIYNGDADSLAKWANHQLGNSDLPKCMLDNFCFPAHL
ncbi:hypothetical protein IFM89_016046 [Coptis chinensis]|uniref:RNase H type-1 domain-containing protein n=1 Tax=Coptis chinensis TaxID=261450 RepID=A0A835H3A3_9MAGN|nr:hypothetical protein IFM89_016046 [Coptis chinensis]